MPEAARSLGSAAENLLLHGAAGSPYGVTVTKAAPDFKDAAEALAAGGYLECRYVLTEAGLDLLQQRAGSAVRRES
jgi:hypothetical protein